MAIHPDEYAVQRRLRQMFDDNPPFDGIGVPSLKSRRCLLGQLGPHGSHAHGSHRDARLVPTPGMVHLKAAQTYISQQAAQSRFESLLNAPPHPATPSLATKSPAPTASLVQQDALSQPGNTHVTLQPNAHFDAPVPSPENGHDPSPAAALPIPEPEASKTESLMAARAKKLNQPPLSLDDETVLVQNQILLKVQQAELDQQLAQVMADAKYLPSAASILKETAAEQARKQQSQVPSILPGSLGGSPADDQPVVAVSEEPRRCLPEVSEPARLETGLATAASAVINEVAAAGLPVCEPVRLSPVDQPAGAPPAYTPSVRASVRAQFSHVFETTQENVVPFSRDGVIQANINRLFHRFASSVVQEIDTMVNAMSEEDLLNWRLPDRYQPPAAATRVLSQQHNLPASSAAPGPSEPQVLQNVTVPKLTPFPGLLYPEPLQLTPPKIGLKPAPGLYSGVLFDRAPKLSLNQAHERLLSGEPQAIAPIKNLSVSIDSNLSYDSKHELQRINQGDAPMVDLSNYKDLTKPPVDAGFNDARSASGTATENVVSMEPHQPYPGSGLDLSGPPPEMENYVPDIEPMYSENVRTLIKLVQDLPEGVSKPTGAQIIRLTMEAMGISMEGVLSEAQHVQSEMLDGVRSNIKKIEEYKTIIWKLESEIRAQQSKANELSEIIDLFVSHHSPTATLKKPEISLSTDGLPKQ